MQIQVPQIRTAWDQDFLCVDPLRADAYTPDGSILKPFKTLQAGYDAANSANKSLLLLAGGSSDFGNVTLAANWNPLVQLLGLSRDLTTVGNIVATNSGNGFDVSLKAWNLTVGNITTSTANASSPFQSGEVEISGNASVGNITTSATGTADAGDVTLEGIKCGNIDTTAASGVPGIVYLERSDWNQCDTRATAGSNNAGLVTAVGTSPLTALTGSRSIVNSSAGGTASVVLRNAAIAFINSSTTACTVTAKDSSFLSSTGTNPCITVISGTSVFVGCSLKTSVNANCIGNVSADGAKFINTIMDANAANNEIQASVARTIIGLGLLTKNSLFDGSDASNVTFSEAANCARSANVQVL